MIKRVTFLALFLVLVPFAGPVAMAVWPPATSLQAEASRKDLRDNMEQPTQPCGIVERLEYDERRLDEILRDLKETKEQLKKFLAEEPKAGKHP